MLVAFLPSEDLLQALNPKIQKILPKSSLEKKVTEAQTESFHRFCNLV